MQSRPQSFRFFTCELYILLVSTSSRKANSPSEYEDKSLCILSWKGIKIASIFLSHFLFLMGSTMVRRLSFGSFALLAYPAFSNRSIIPIGSLAKARKNVTMKCPNVCYFTRNKSLAMFIDIVTSFNKFRMSP